MIEIPDGDDQSGIVSSPGYPYIVPEHSECRWTLKAQEGKVCQIEKVEVEIIPAFIQMK